MTTTEMLMAPVEGKGIVQVGKVVSLDSPDPTKFRDLIGPPIRLDERDQKREIAKGLDPDPTNPRYGGHPYEDAFLFGAPMGLRQTFVDMTDYFAEQQGAEAFLKEHGLSVGIEETPDQKRDRVMAATARRMGYDYQSNRGQKRITHCSRCGETGHNRRTCVARHAQ